MQPRHVTSCILSLYPLVRRAVFVVTALTFAVLLASAVPASAAPLLAVTPSVSVPASLEGMIGENLTFTISFDNTGTGAETGYGPIIDLYLPTTGADGAGAATDDGITFVSATYLGVTLNTVQSTFGAGGTVNHPWAVVYPTGNPVVVSGTPGDRLVSIELPFGSFTPDQPAVQVQVTVSISSLADAGTPLTMYARGGFRYGTTPLNDWCCIEGSLMYPASNTAGPPWPQTVVTPTVMSISKSYDGPEGETATGPNFIRHYTIKVDVATGQLISGLQVTDILPPNVQFVSVSSSSPAGTINPASTVDPVTPTPGGALIFDFTNPITGAAGVDATLQIEFYVPLNTGSGPVIDPDSGDAAASDNTSDATANWVPTDSRDLPGPVTAACVGCTHTLSDRSIAIQKSVAIAAGGDTGYAGYSPGDTVQYTLNFQVSDFFAFQDIVVTDVLSDGHDYLAGTASVSVTEHGSTSTAAIIPTVVVDGVTGETTLTFNVSAALAAAQPLLGGCVPAGGTGGGAPGTPPDCSFNGGQTTGTLTFQAQIREDYRIVPPSGDISVDHGDTLTNSTTITGNLLNVGDLTPNGFSEPDGSSAGLTIVQGTLTKTIYAINGVVGTYTNPVVAPDDTITYRLEYVLPNSDTERLRFEDFLPLPVLHATEISTTFVDTISAAAPPAGQAKFGPTDTFRTYSGIVPTVSINANGNSVTFDYGTFDLPAMTATTKVDILFTVTMSDDPFTDGLYLTNQARVSESNSFNEVTNIDGIIRFILGEPIVRGTKSIVAITSSNPSAVISPAPPGGVFNAPGTPGVRWTVPVLSASDVGNRNAASLNGNDLVTFAILIQNSGSSPMGAFDIEISDALQPQYQIPGGPGLNLRVSYGDGVAVPYTDLGGGLFGTGIRIDDPGPAQGACEAPGHTAGHDIIVITYDLQVMPGVAPLQQINNTASLNSYAGTEGGPNHLAAPQTESARVTIAGTSGKSVNRTSMTVGETYTQAIDITIPPFTTAYQRGATGRTFVRDTILDAGARMVPGSATFAMTAPCSGIDLSSFTIGSTPGPTTIVVTETDLNPGARIEWSLPAPINNLANSAACSFRVTVDLTVVDVDTFSLPTPNLRAWAPPANNLSLDDSARFEYGTSTGGNVNGPTSTAAVAVDQPWIYLEKSVPLILAYDGVTPRTGDLRGGDFVVYLFTLENRGEATAYEVGVIDTLPPYMSYVPGSAFRDDGSGGGVAGDGIQNGSEASLADPSISGTPAPGGQTLSFNYNLDIPVGPTQIVPVAFRAQVLGSMPPGQVFVNVADANWSTLDGSQPGERLYDATYDAGGSMDGLDTPNTENQDRAEVTLTGIDISLTLDKTFVQPIITVGGRSDLRFTVTNPNATTTLTGISYEDTLPGGLTVAGAEVFNPAGCMGPGAVLTALVGSSSITLTDGTLAPGDSCEITVPISGDAIGVYDNVSGPIISNETGQGVPATASLVVTDTLAVHKQFTPDRIQQGDTSTLTFTLLNPATVGPAANMTNISFVDTLPAAVYVASAPNVVGDCNGGSVTADPGSSTISLAGGALGPGESCQISVDVTSIVPGTYLNQTEAPTAEDSNETVLTGMPSNQAPLTVYAIAVSITDPPMTKTGNPATAAIGDDVVWTIILNNPAGTVYPNATVSDPVPDQFTVNNVTTTKGTVIVDRQLVTVNVGPLDPGEVVTIQIHTTVNELAVPGTSYTNVAFLNGTRATATVAIFPGELPATGVRPLLLRWPVLLAAGAALIAALGVLVWRRRA